MRIGIEQTGNVEQQRMLRETTPPDFLDSSVERDGSILSARLLER
jgi:hypothetical protein